MKRTIGINMADKTERRDFARMYTREVTKRQLHATIVEQVSWQIDWWHELPVLHLRTSPLDSNAIY